MSSGARTINVSVSQLIEDSLLGLLRLEFHDDLLLQRPLLAVILFDCSILTSNSAPGHSSIYLQELGVLL